MRHADNPLYAGQGNGGGNTLYRVTATQAKVYQRAIDEHRKLETLLEDIRTTSLQILEATTPGVIKRKQPKQQNLRPKSVPFGSVPMFPQFFPTPNTSGCGIDFHQEAPRYWGNLSVYWSIGSHMGGVVYVAVVTFLWLGLLLAAISAMVLFQRVWTAQSKLRSFAVNALLTCFSFAFLFLAFEMYCRLAVASDGFGTTLAAKRWAELYDVPRNSMRYRDDEHRPEDFKGRRALLVLGDSFARGSGIRNYRDVCSQVLRRKLGEGWEVANISRCGWDTTHELDALKAYPVRPDVVVLEYYLNDIHHAATLHNLAWIPPFSEPPAVLKPLVDNSYLANKVFWSVCRIQLGLAETTFRDRMLSYYDLPDVWAAHAQELQAFVDQVGAFKARLIVLIIPNLFAVEQSVAAASRVAAFMTANNVEVIDMTPMLIKRDPGTMVVNPVDGHANEALNREMADLLYPLVQKGSAPARPESR